MPLIQVRSGSTQRKVRPQPFFLRPRQWPREFSRATPRAVLQQHLSEADIPFVRLTVSKSAVYALLVARRPEMAPARLTLDDCYRGALGRRFYHSR